MKCDLSLSEVAPQNPKLLSLICMYLRLSPSLSRLSRNEHRRCRAKRILFFVKPFSTIWRHAEKGSSWNHKNICNKHVGGWISLTPALHPKLLL